MRENLNERCLRSLKAPAPGQRDEYWDEKQHGLVLRVSAEFRTWYLFYRDAGGSKQRYKLGRYPGIGADAARDLARDKLTEIGRGADLGRRAPRAAPCT